MSSGQEHVEISVGTRGPDVLDPRTSVAGLVHDLDSSGSRARLDLPHE